MSAKATENRKIGEKTPVYGERTRYGGQNQRGSRATALKPRLELLEAVGDTSSAASVKLLVFEVVSVTRRYGSTPSIRR